LKKIEFLSMVPNVMEELVAADIGPCRCLNSGIAAAAIKRRTSAAVCAVAVTAVITGATATNQAVVSADGAVTSIVNAAAAVIVGAAADDVNLRMSSRQQGNRYLKKIQYDYLDGKTCFSKLTHTEDHQPNFYQTWLN
jgi:hypothetical protein